MSTASESLFAGVNQLNTPVLIIQGGADPLRVACSDSLEARLSDGERFVIACGRHFPWVEKPGEFRALVTNWLDELPKQLKAARQPIA